MTWTIELLLCWYMRTSGSQAAGSVTGSPTMLVCSSAKTSSISEVSSLDDELLDDSSASWYSSNWRWAFEQVLRVFIRCHAFHTGTAEVGLKGSGPHLVQDLLISSQRLCQNITGVNNWLIDSLWSDALTKDDSLGSLQTSSTN